MIINRCDLWDSAAHFQPEGCYQFQTHGSISRVLQYKFEASNNVPNESSTEAKGGSGKSEYENTKMLKEMTVAVARVPHQIKTNTEFFHRNPLECSEDQPHCSVIDNVTPNPHANVVHNKYWAQRRYVKTDARFSRKFY